MNTDLKQTSWDNSNVYKSFKDPQIKRDLESIASNIEKTQMEAMPLKEVLDKLDALSFDQMNILTDLAIEISARESDNIIKFYTLMNYVGMAISVDSQNHEARELQGQVSMLGSKIEQARTPLDLFLSRCSNEVIDNFLKDER